jgi:glyoxylase-like metal-dependent hydrolase (beta-lactamase superfamily II)/ferredoxin
MADPKRRDAHNVAGAWFVDTTCIACDACRQCAPTVFREHADGTSSVARQPANDDEKTAAARAMLACPVGAIGKERVPGDGPVKINGIYPQLLDDGVWYCGYNSPKSYGGNAYLLATKSGLVLIDAPRFVSSVVDFIAAHGGLCAVLLTHGDDVGDSDRYAERFGCPVYLHEADGQRAPFATSTWPDVAVECIHVPGHTRGSVVFLAGDRLFTGDSLAWSRDENRLMAFHDACWFSWSEQKRSLAKLVDKSFAWVLPGHGQRHKSTPEDMRSGLVDLVARM